MLRRRTMDGRARSKSRGQSLVEFALILPVFLVLFSAALDFGRLAAARLAIANAAREGAFQASMTPDSYQSGQPCPTPDSNGTTPTTNLVVCRTILESKGSVITIAPTDISMSCTPDCTPALGSTATVKVVGRFQFLTPFMAAIFGGYTLDFASASTTQLDVTPTMPPLAGDSPAPTASPSAAPSVTAAPTAAPNCSSVSAGFTMVKSPTNGRSPVTVVVTDTTTYNPACVTTWTWDWGDGTTTFGQVQPPHVYYNAGPANKTFTITLTVTSGAITSRFGGQQILVKP